MAGRNTTGKYRTSDSWLTGGQVFVSPLASAEGYPGDWREIGCVQSLTVNSESDVAELFCAPNGVRTKVAEGITQVSADIELVVSDLSYENLAMALLGSADVYTQLVGNTGQAVGLIAVPDVSFDATRQIGGRWYNLNVQGNVASMGRVLAAGSVESTRVMALTDVNDVTLTVDAAAYQHDGVNMDVDLDLGVVFVYSGSALEADLQAVAAASAGYGTSEYVVLTSGTAAGQAQVKLGNAASPSVDTTTLDQFKILTEKSRNYALRIRQVNSDGKVAEVIFHSANLRPNGDLGFISPEEYAEMTLAGSLNSHSVLGFATGRVVGG